MKATKAVIESHLLVSISHISQEDYKLLMEASAVSYHPDNWGNPLSSNDHQENNPLSIYPYFYGFYVHVPEKSPTLNSALTEFGYTDAMATIIEFAQEVEASYITLDESGQQYEHLPTYDWD